MKNLFILALVLVPQLCFADLYVLVDKQTKEVLSASEKDDSIPAQGQEIIKLKGALADFTDENPVNYRFVNNKFIKNIEKISKQEQDKAVEIKKQTEEAIMQKEIRAQAIKSLKDKGVELKNVNE